MKIYKAVIILLTALISACSLTSFIDKNDQGPLAKNEAIYWINSAKVECIGIVPMMCLQAQKGELLVQQRWEYFYSSIEEFNYEAGNIYKLVIKEETIPVEQLPADASSIKYSLVKILEKTPDVKLRLNDIWALEKIQGELISIGKRIERPRLEIHLQDMRIVGSDGCNNFSGAIRSLVADKITFGPVASTRMYCQEMAVPDQFNRHIGRIHSYRVNELNLYLFDEQGDELLSFKKID